MSSSSQGFSLYSGPGPTTRLEGSYLMWATT